MLQKLDHKNDAITIINFMINDKYILRRAIITPAMFIGNIQYPNTHKLYKNPTFPPNILALIVTTTEPPHIIINIVPNKESVL